MKLVTRGRIHHWRLPATRILVGLVFVYAGVAKVSSSEDFGAKVAAFRIMPPSWSFYAGQGLPFFEAIVGFWLLLGWRPRLPALAALLMSGAFAAIVTLAMARGLDIACGCFGPKGPVATGLVPTLAIDLLLLGGAWIVYREASRRAGQELTAGATGRLTNDADISRNG